MSRNRDFRRRGMVSSTEGESMSTDTESEVSRMAEGAYDPSSIVENPEPVENTAPLELNTMGKLPELQPESSHQQEDSDLSTASMLEEVAVVESLPEPEAPAPLPIVNPAQNFTSDAQIKSWQSKDPTNVLFLLLEQMFDTYENVMRPKRPINKADGGQQQTALYQMIVRVAQDRQHFRENWAYILHRFHRNPNHIYDINYVMRFMDAMSVTKADTILFPRLLNLIIHTSNPNTISDGLRRVSLEKTLQTVSSSVMRGNIMGYYRQFIN